MALVKLVKVFEGKMSKISLSIKIDAPIERVFDLSRSIDLHTVTQNKHGEKPVSGTTSGLINLGQDVTWEAKHLGVRQRLTSKITAYEDPTFFVDEMVKGAFKRFQHQHFFEEKEGKTCMTDVFDFTSPLGIIGKIANKIFLTNYMKKFLITRNQIIKEYAESNKWKEILDFRP